MTWFEHLKVLAKSARKALAVILLCVLGATAFVYQICQIAFVDVENIPNQSKHPLVYIKGAQLLAYTGRSKPIVLSATIPHDFAGNTQISAGGTKIFYADNVDDGGFVLNYRSVGGKTSSSKVFPVGGVTDYTMDSNGRFVLYEQANQLYIADASTTELLASRPGFYCFGNDGKAVLFEDGGNLYLRSTQPESVPRLLESAYNHIIYVQDDFERILYVKDEVLYLAEGNSKVPIANGAVKATVVGGDIIYVVTRDGVTKTFDQLFEDDCEQSDAAIKRPVFINFQTISGGAASFNHEAYDKANQRYREKLERDKLREYYRDSEHKLFVYNLHKYENGELVKLDEGLVDGTLHLAQGGGGFCYAKSAAAEFSQRVKLSEVTSFAEAAERLIGEKDAGREVYVVKGGEAPLKALDLASKSDACVLSKNGDYLFAALKKEEGRELFRYPVGVGTIGEPIKLGDNISEYLPFGNGDVAMTTMVEGQRRIEVYSGDTLQKLTENGAALTHAYGSLFFLDQYNSNTNSGTLLSWRKNQMHVIDENVYGAFDVRSKDSVAYIKNYDTIRKQGQLFIRNEKSTMMVDEVVRAISGRGSVDGKG